MSDWRRQKPRNRFNNHPQRGTTKSSKPPLGKSVPGWEKEFCAVIGSVPWKKVVEAKKDMYLYDKVVQWDDSAGEEAFKNAKARFYAERKGLACDLSLPDRDAYIDVVDWDAEVDIELILDLDRDGPEPRREGEEQVVNLDALVVPEEYKGPGWGTGWGEAEGINEKPKNSWDDEQIDGWNADTWGGIKEKTETWDHQNYNNNSGFKTESWGHQNNNGFKTESWNQKNNYNNNGFKTESWGHKNNYNNNGFKTESWGHKKSYNNNFNQKKVENWNGRAQGTETREWRKRGDVPRRGDQVEDCRWRNGRGRNRGGFQQNSNGWGCTETF